MSAPPITPEGHDGGTTLAGFAGEARADRFRHISFLDYEHATSTRPAAPAHPAGTRRRQRAPLALNPESAAYFEVLCSRWGLRADRYRTSILRRRQAASLRALRATSMRAGAISILRDPEAAEVALGAVMIGVTSFFRDPPVFASLRASMRGLHRVRGPLRVLSVGCSTGAELYSVAMQMAEDDILDGAKLRGMDCRPTAIDKAREGSYPVEVVQSVPEGLRVKYFAARDPRGNQGDGKLQIVNRLRDACSWQVSDVFAQQAGLYDVILCRNLAIYLTPESAAELWSLLVLQLSPGGLLVVGKAERPSPPVRATLLRHHQCVYQRRTLHDERE